MIYTQNAPDHGGNMYSNYGPEPFYQADALLFDDFIRVAKHISIQK